MNDTLYKAWRKVDGTVVEFMSTEPHCVSCVEDRFGFGRTEYPEDACCCKHDLEHKAVTVITEAEEGTLP